MTPLELAAQIEYDGRMAPEFEPVEYVDVHPRDCPLIAAALRLAEAALKVEDCCGTISESGCSRNISAEPTTDLQTLLPAYRAARGAAK